MNFKACAAIRHVYLIPQQKRNMNRLFLFFCTAVLTAGCAQPEEEHTLAQQTTTTVKDSIDPTNEMSVGSIAGCYTMIIGKDTAYMKLKQSGSEASGSLVYKRAEKDNSSGEVTLTVKKYHARGWYQFMSEGKMSVREIAFELNNSNLSEAYGDIEMKGDSAVFKYPHSLRFENDHPFILTACK